MVLYQFSWFVLFSPLFSFVVIIFGTRMWDLFSRPRTVQASAPGGHGEHEAGAHDVAHGDAEHGESESMQEYDDDPQLPSLTPGAKWSGYIGVFIMALACIYAWLLLLNTTGVIDIAKAMPPGGVLVFSYTWLNQGATANYLVAFRVDKLAIVMMVVVTTVSLLVQFYSQGYMDNSAGYARFFAYLSLFTFSMLVIVFAANFLTIFIGWELVGLSSYLLIGFWINKRAKPDEDRPQPATAAIQAFIVNRI